MNPGELNGIMSFDHVIEVTVNGEVTESDMIAPDLRNGELMDEAWELLQGYSGQDSGKYNGPIMHNSEFIGGKMETDILDHPGVYVALVCYWDADEDDEDEHGPIEGWAVAQLKEKA